MSSQAKVALASLFLLLMAGAYSYSRFNNFKPKNLQPLEEVHGAATSATGNIPFPQNYVLLGSTKTEHARQITFETEMSAEAVQDFYKNIFLEKGWQVEYDGRSGSSLTTGYKLQKENLKVVSSPQEESNKSVVSVEFTF